VVVFGSGGVGGGGRGIETNLVGKAKKYWSQLKRIH
jgi:hypothetical protein